MKSKFYTMYGKAVDSNGFEHIVTIVGECVQNIETEIESEELDVVDGKRCEKGILSYPHRKKTRTLRYSFSICHPDDEFNESDGIKIAKRRLSKPLGELKTSYITCLTPEQINMILFEELHYIIKHIDKFIERI